ncbi:MAG: protein-export membrane protein SecD [Candidatus Staskawiczbacteria bacterium RIFOXYC1_FULL_37_43]|nr:MAG: protein-export membrane protein SecD [Candidatus Staskawiczbacteria bacterium RIFCSPHIGHO2_01_FULL_37_17]OGZ71466.1 MAG: protein-export membrane protein SecD [Candidatus Staskawiczbacteria bacterium RIFCSPLOWO2_01_FULL_37_19]OGZ76141.1 MAG: protein-export membrane protein SecD [Candidatus Staskawiczbacteria bacterium RIFOXYA1_FULL_37_15]OGZ80109.1 MAG: protein-export membrane protein SecD [Candidatus Staskawiczbacteria bacterium RIFOXYB1_FULL_38_37]OGZ81747.1 MAG: protein-export membran
MQQKYYIFIAVLILAVLAGIFSYPNYVNKAIDYLNSKAGWTLWHFPEKPYILGLDLQGGVQLIYQADLSSVEDKSGAMAGLRDVIERRVNMFGVSEPVVQIQGQDRLLVELPGVTDVKQAIDMIGQTPYLEFDEERTAEEAQQIIDKMKEVQAVQDEGGDITSIENWELALQNPYYKPTELTGKYLTKANVIFDPTTYKPQIELRFNDEGAKIFEQITERNVNKSLAIFLDGASIIDTNGDGKIDVNDLYAPNVQEKISGGKAVITGDMSTQKANEIARRLNSGALPVKIGSPISQETVGPTLGYASLQKSLLAGIFGLLAVVVFMVLIYRLPGLLASFALIIYVAIVLSLFKLIPVTLTLAGIGGFILSIGMAVDANILIFARMKEEIKAGKGLSQAIDEGFRRAWSSIRDSNFNSLIVCAILFFVATSFIKGFAFTLALGIIISLFSAIFITRIFLQVFVGKWTEKAKWLL